MGSIQFNKNIDLQCLIIPIKIENLRIGIKIPPEYAAKVKGVSKEFGKITNEEWQSDGSWIAILELPAGLHNSFLESIGKITRGNYQTKILR